MTTDGFHFSVVSRPRRNRLAARGFGRWKCQEQIGRVCEKWETGAPQDENCYVKVRTASGPQIGVEYPSWILNKCCRRSSCSRWVDLFVSKEYRIMRIFITLAHSLPLVRVPKIFLYPRTYCAKYFRRWRRAGLIICKIFLAYLCLIKIIWKMFCENAPLFIL